MRAAAAARSSSRRLMSDMFTEPSARKKKDDSLLPSEDRGALPSSSSGKQSTFASGKIVLRRAYRLAKPFYLGPRRRRAFQLSILLGIAMVAETSVFVRYSGVQKAYMTSLQKKDEEGFWQGLQQVAMLIAVFVPITAVHRFTQEALNIEWRRDLTHVLGKSYFGSQGSFAPFYDLYLSSDVDNPDQRITQDCPAFIGSAVQLVLDVVGTILRCSAFAKVLWDISPKVCAGVMSYVVCGTLISVKGFGPFIMHYQMQTITKEANLRYSLIRVRENAESIAFFQGGPAEFYRFDTLFTILVTTLYERLQLLTGFGMFMSTFRFATFAVPALAVGPAYLRGEVEFGAISQCSMAFNVMMDGLMLIMNKQREISGLVVEVERLSKLQETLEKQALGKSTNAMAGVQGCTSIAHIEERGKHLEAPLVLKDVLLRTPPPVLQTGHDVQQTLVENLSLQVSKGDRLLIAGDSGAGKSSLLRSIAGLWSEGSGSIHTGVRSSMFFMPQRPYMCMGTLRSQLLYPREEDLGVPDSDLRQVLALVNLGYLLERHDMSDEKDWSSMLSLGEQQRVNFARLLLRTDISMVLLDEGTSACDPKNESILYSLLAEKVPTYISVGHRPALRRFHTHALLLRRHAATPSSVLEQGSPRHSGASSGATHSFMSMAEFEQTGVFSELS
mmetsp:Transcript_42876/g.100600  ORF Transcript_42876/g.100600 Transcript_42876/m.100600 type:complete len:671 (+) Transcript_42876:117-2129(+)